MASIVFKMDKIVFEKAQQIRNFFFLTIYSLGNIWELMIAMIPVQVH